MTMKDMGGFVSFLSVIYCAVHSSTQVTGDGEESEYDELSERMEHMGFTASEFDELISQGVRPWDDDAWDVLRVLNDGYYDEYSDDEYY